MLEVNLSAILDVNNPSVLLGNFFLCAAHYLMLYGQYGEATKQFEIACKVIIYGLLVSKVEAYTTRLDEISLFDS
jgi:hypothetical protein